MLSTMNFCTEDMIASASAVAAPNSLAKRLHHEAFNSSGDATLAVSAAAPASCGNQKPIDNKRRRNSKSRTLPPRSPVSAEICTDEQWARLVAHLHAEADTSVPEEGDRDVRRVLLRFAKSTLDKEQWDFAVSVMTYETPRLPGEKKHDGKIINMRKEEMQCLLRLFFGHDALKVIEALIKSRKGWARERGIFPVLAGLVSVLWRRVDRPVGISEASGFFLRDSNQNYGATDKLWEAMDGTGELWPSAMPGNKPRQCSPVAEGIASSCSIISSGGACLSDITNACGASGAAFNDMATSGNDDEGETTSIMVPGHRTYSLTTGLIPDHSSPDENPGIISNNAAQHKDMTKQQVFDQWQLGDEATVDQTNDIDLHDFIAEFDATAPDHDHWWVSPMFNSTQGAHAEGTTGTLSTTDSGYTLTAMTHNLATLVSGNHQAPLGDSAPNCKLAHLGQIRPVMGEVFISPMDYDLFTLSELEVMFSDNNM